MKTAATLADLTDWVVAKATAYASLHGVEPTQPELDDFFSVMSPRRWRWWLDRPVDYQEALLAAWLTGVRMIRGGSRPPTDGNPVMVAARALYKIAEIAERASAAMLVLAKKEGARE